VGVEKSSITLIIESMSAIAWVRQLQARKPNVKMRFISLP